MNPCIHPCAHPSIVFLDGVAHPEPCGREQEFCLVGFRVDDQATLRQRLQERT